MNAPRSRSSPLNDSRAEFSAAIEPLMPDLLSYFVRRVSPREDAADCLSDTLVALWRHGHRMPQGDIDRRRWAFGFARLTLANHQRGQGRQRALSQRVRDHLRENNQPESYGATSVADALDALDEQDRELVRLIVWDGFGVAEAGNLLGLRAGAARMRFSRAKATLKSALHPHSDQESS